MKIFARILLFSLFLFSQSTSSQTVYKTPSGGKYHTPQCHYVKNVSNAMSISRAIEMGLEACKQCKPNSNSQALGFSSSSSLGIKSNEAKGTAYSIQCKGLTQKGTRCKHKTRNKNGYCHQHER